MEEAIRPQSLYIFFEKNDKLWGCDKTKGLRLGAVNCRTVIKKYIGDTNGRAG